LKTIEISERSLLIVFERGELSKHLPCGDFDVSDMRSRKALRTMLDTVVEKTGREMSQRVRLDMLGSDDTEVNIFCTFDETSADSLT
jgi:hypothetical protein